MLMVNGYNLTSYTLEQLKSLNLKAEDISIEIKFNTTEKFQHKLLTFSHEFVLHLSYHADLLQKFKDGEYSLEQLYYRASSDEAHLLIHYAANKDYEKVNDSFEGLMKHDDSLNAHFDLWTEFELLAKSDEELVLPIQVLNEGYLNKKGRSTLLQYFVKLRSDERTIDYNPNTVGKYTNLLSVPFDHKLHEQIKEKYGKNNNSDINR